MKKLLLTIGLLLPMSVSALEYQNLSLLYTDAPFLPAEAAGISLLTSLNAVQGNPDGTFMPNRSINRAEFLKIVLASYPRVRVSTSDAERCFPDVNESDWFSPYVCLAKKRGMVSGYPDGTFKPDRTANYAEALKILGELYDYVAYSAEDEPWYSGYVRAAQFNKTALPIGLAYDRALTRGQMARLAAAYRAQYEGELEFYRLSEISFNAVLNKIKEAEEAEEEEEAEEPQQEEQTSNESMNQQINVPTTSHFLMLGERSNPIADGTFTPTREYDAELRSVTVQLWAKAKSFEKLFLVDEFGNEIAELKLDVYDKEDETWKAVIDLDEPYVMDRSGTILAIEAQLWGRDDRGIAEEQVRVKKFTAVVSDLNRTESYELVAQDTHFPAHQTVQAEIKNVYNSLMEVGSFEEGTAKPIAEFTVKGRKLDGADLRIEHMKFTLSKAEKVRTERWKITAYDTNDQAECSLSNNIVSCLNLSSPLGDIPALGRVYKLYANVTNDGINPWLRADLLSPGTFGVDGAIWWTDGSGHYTWIESDEPVARGTEWR